MTAGARTPRTPAISPREQNVGRGIDPFTVVDVFHHAQAATGFRTPLPTNPLLRKPLEYTISPWVWMVGRGIDPFTVMDVLHHVPAGTGFHTPLFTEPQWLQTPRIHYLPMGVDC